jgi:acylphosphatase
VGFRWFVQRSADQLGIRGYTRNLDDGRVEVYAVASPEKLNELSGLLWTGPRLADVRGVDEEEAEIQTVRNFRIA